MILANQPGNVQFLFPDLDAPGNDEDEDEPSNNEPSKNEPGEDEPTKIEPASNEWTVVMEMIKRRTCNRCNSWHLY